MNTPDFPVGDVTSLLGSGQKGKPEKKYIKDIQKAIVEKYPSLNYKGSMLLESLQPQVGKSMLECSILWLRKFVYKQVAILMGDDNISSQTQFMTRDFPSFNKFIDSLNIPNSVRYHLYPKQLMARTSKTMIRHWFENRDVILTTINASRQRNLLRFLEEENFRFALVYDEADMRFADVDPETKVLKEVYARQIEDVYAKPVYYITATGFACANSPYRKKSLYQKVVPQINDGMEYRGYEFFEKEHTDTLAIRQALHDDSLDECNEWCNFVKKVGSGKTGCNQPEIALINIAQKVDDHTRIAKSILNIAENAVVLVYNNQGVSHHEKQGKHIFYVQDANGTRPIRAKIISQALQSLKDSGIFKPIFIVSGIRASRAETFKSSDHSWILTRVLLALPESATMESIIQYQRQCGIYRKDAPKAIVYISLQDNVLVSKCLENKYIIAEKLQGHAHDHRKHLRQINLNKIRGGLTRKSCEDAHIEANHIRCLHETKTSKEMKKYIKKTFPDRTIIRLTKHFEIKVMDLPYLDLLRREHNFESLHTIKGGQAQVKKCIKEHIVRFIKGDTLQLAYYREREEELNGNPLSRPKQKYAKFIAFSPGIDIGSDVLTIPVVQYLYDLDQIESFASDDHNNIYVWHTTMGTVRCSLTKRDTLQQGYYVDTK